jgi:predicted AlkP superfamily phosphohydrolase/phosphomutase
MLGLDGAGYDLVSELCERGVTPNLAALARAGSFGPLRSTVPPITGPSWLGLASGLDVDQTGIADFLVRCPPLFDLRPIGSRDFKGRALWDAIGAAGARTAVVNFPILYPPYPINGAMVSGFGADESTQWTFPAELKGELLDAVGRDYNLTINYHHEVYDDAHRFLDDLEASLDRRLRAADVVCRREPWDLFMFVLSETDWMLHRCWADLDARHPRHDPARSPAVAERVHGVWARIDAAIPRLLDALGAGASVLVCSDHGFGPNTRTLKINLLLEREGLLVRRPAASRPGAAIRRAGARAAQRAGAAASRVGGPVGRALSRARRRARRYLPRDESAYLAAVVDFERSLAFDPGHTIPFAGLYVAPRAERGGAEYLEAISRVEEALDRYGRSAGVALVARRAWLEAPDRPETLPDLVVSGDGWACTFLKADFAGEPLTNASFSPRHTGSHRAHGLYLASGPAFAARGAGAEASILDIAPTALALFGLAAPADRRGRVLDVLADAPSELRPPELAGAPAPDRDRSEEDEADVRERLRGLGYIE